MCDNKIEELDDRFITLVDEEGKTYEFERLDAIETDDGRFVALCPVMSENEAGDSDVEEYYILQVVGTGEDEELVDIEDDEMLDGLAEIFDERLAEMYEEDEPEPEENA